jgi:hypothetical protein
MLMHANFAPGTNISKAYYKLVVDKIEHDPLIKHSTFSVVCLVAAISVLTGALMWFSKTNPGNLIQTQGTITSISSGKTDTVGTITTFVSFSFNTSDGKPVEVRQPAAEGLAYETGQVIPVGYFPKNPNFARNLSDKRPPAIALALWLIPFALMIWLGFLALFRHHARQVEIWEAAEAADSDE